jgi:hypothetical protein
MKDATNNQGEGDRESAQHYNEAVSKTARKMQPEDFSREQHLSQKAKDDMRRAEAIGKARAKEEDPQLSQNVRDRQQPAD